MTATLIPQHVTITKDSTLEQVLDNIIQQSFAELHEPCKVPIISSYERDLRRFQEPKPFTTHKFPILNVPVVNILLRLYQSISDPHVAVKILVVLGLHIYSSLFRKHFKYCDATRLRYALDRVKSSNYIKRFGPAKAIILWSKAMLNKFGLRTNEHDTVMLYLYYRTAISQSIKAISIKYYAFDPDEIAKQEKASQLAVMLADQLVNKFQFGINKQCYSNALNKSQLNSEQAKELLNLCVNDAKFSKDLYALSFLGVTTRHDICRGNWWLSLRKRALVYTKNPLSVLLTKQALYYLNVDYDENSDDIASQIPQNQQLIVQQMKLFILSYYYCFACSHLC